MSFTDYLENKLLDHILGGGDYTRPATVYVGVSSTAPADDGTNITEPSGGSYARVAVTNNATNWPAASGGSKSNGTQISFPVATADWLAAANITHFFIADDPTAGNILGSGALDSPVTVLDTQMLYFAIGALVVTQG